MLAALALGGFFVFVACGETRRPHGGECLRDDDCLSGRCEARACAEPPREVTGVSRPAGTEGPLIPSVDPPRVPSDASADAQEGG